MSGEDEFDDDLDDDDLLVAALQAETVFVASQRPLQASARPAPAPPAKVAAARPHINGNGAARPQQQQQSFGRAPPKKPVYRDEVDLDALRAKGIYDSKPKTSSSNQDEVEQLRQQIKLLQKTADDEKKARQAREGEAKMLRNRTEAAEKDAMQRIKAEQAKSAQLQAELDRKIVELKGTEEAHKTSDVFNRHIYQSNAKPRSGSQHPATVRKPVSSTQQRSPKTIKMPKKKGFQNSFIESSPIDGGRRAAQTSSPPRMGKGKGRATSEQIEHEGNDFMDDMTTVEQVEEEEYIPQPTLEDFTSFVFGHTDLMAVNPISTIYAMVNLSSDIPRTEDEAFLQSHREACKQLFACLGTNPESSALDPIERDHIFLSRLLRSLVQFAEVFSQAGCLHELVLGLHLIRDLLFQYHDFLFRQSIVNTEHSQCIKAIFTALVRINKASQARLAKASIVIKKKPQASYSTENVKEQQAAVSTEKMKAERQAEPVYLAILDILAVLAWLPDQTTVDHFDTALREAGFISTFININRPTIVIERALRVCLALAAQASFFRPLLSCPVTRDIDSGQAKQADNPLAFVEAVAAYVLYKSGAAEENHRIQSITLNILSTLAVIQPDGVPLLGQSSSIVQRLVLRISREAAVLYESASLPQGGIPIEDVTDLLSQALHLLHFLVLSKKAMKTLTVHLDAKPLSRDYLLSGVGRVACSEVPEWIEDAEQMRSLDISAGVAYDLLGDVLSPDEIDELYSLCRDEEEEDEPGQDLNEVDEEGAIVAREKQRNGEIDED